MNDDHDAIVVLVIALLQPHDCASCHIAACSRQTPWAASILSSSRSSCLHPRPRDRPSLHCVSIPQVTHDNGINHRTPGPQPPCRLPTLLTPNTRIESTGAQGIQCDMRSTLGSKASTMTSMASMTRGASTMGGAYLAQKVSLFI